MTAAPFVPYQRKALYLALTVPMIALYAVIAVYLWTVSAAACIVYLAFFILVAVSQAYVCVCWDCPYVGRFGPCVGGFCLPSSQIARLFKNVRQTKTAYNIVVTIAFIAFFGIIFWPMYFIYRLGPVYLLLYIGLVMVYTPAFLLSICPVCASRHVCPAGQASTKLRNLAGR